MDSIVFSNVSISDNILTGFAAYRSVLTINGSVTLFNNTGHAWCGGMSLYGGSYLTLLPNSNVTFAKNMTTNKGGGLYSDSLFLDCSISTIDPTNILYTIQQKLEMMYMELTYM